MMLLTSVILRLLATGGLLPVTLGRLPSRVVRPLQPLEAAEGIDGRLEALVPLVCAERLGQDALRPGLLARRSLALGDSGLLSVLASRLAGLRRLGGVLARKAVGTRLAAPAPARQRLGSKSSWCSLSTPPSARASALTSNRHTLVP